MDKQARREERTRIKRLSRLPFLYDFAQRGGAQAAVATLVQVSLALALAIGASYLVTGEPLPRYVALVALGVAYALIGLARYLNAKAGRR